MTTHEALRQLVYLCGITGAALLLGVTCAVVRERLEERR